MREPEFVHTFGVMGSGKTLAAIQREMTLDRRKFLYVITKPDIDTRGGATIETRFGDVSRPIDFFTPIPDGELIELTIQALQRKRDDHPELADRKNRALIIDEVNFLSIEQVAAARQLVDKYEVSVYTHGIPTDFTGKPFIGELAARTYADKEKIIKLTADCYGVKDDGACDNNAEFNARLVNGSYVFEGNEVAINEEGEEKDESQTITTYRSLCQKCFVLAQLESQQ
jgi:thymidine kinase